MTDSTNSPLIPKISQSSSAGKQMLWRPNILNANQRSMKSIQSNS